MSTRSTTHFITNHHDNNTGQIVTKTSAIIYRHSDGYPKGHGCDLQDFFAQVEADTKDTRFSDPTYLAAKLVVWLGEKFSHSYSKLPDGSWGYLPPERGYSLDFISVGVCMEDPGDIEYRYTVDCSRHDLNGRPVVTCYSLGYDGEDAHVFEIPTREAEVSVA